MVSKKSIKAQLVTLLLATLLVACQVVKTTTMAPGVTASAPPKNTATLTQEPSITKTTSTYQPSRVITVAPEELRGQIVEFWHPWFGARGIVLTQLVGEFNLHNEWGIFVIAKYMGNIDQLDEQVQERSAQGEVPDIAVGYLHQALQWKENHALVDWEGYVQDAQWGMEEAQQKGVIPAFWEHEQVDGVRLGLPAQRSAQLLLYNHSWAKLLGFTHPPQTPEEFKKQACAAAQYYREDDDLSNDGLGGWIVSTDYAVILSFAYSFDAQIITSGEERAREGGYSFASAEMEETFTFLRDLWDSGCAWEASASYPVAEFAERKGIFAHISLLDLAYQEEAFQRIENRDEWMVIPYPSPSLSPALDVYGLSYYLFASTPVRQLAAWVWIKWLLEEANQARLISVDGSFPLDMATLQALEGYRRAHPQWAAAVELLAQAREEPPYASWETVRWALQDAATQLFRAYFSIEQVPNLLTYLEVTAQELHSGVVIENNEPWQAVTQTP